MKRMLMKSVLILSVALVVGGVACSGGRPGTPGDLSTKTSSPAPVSSSAEVVKVRAGALAISVGSEANAAVTLSILPGFHVNANPATFPYLIATEVTADRIEGITVGKPGYPSAEKKTFQFADEALAVYEGETQIKLPLRADSKAGKGTRSLPIHVRVQACDHEKCYPPSTLDTTIAVDVK